MNKHFILIALLLFNNVLFGAATTAKLALPTKQSNKGAQSAGRENMGIKTMAALIVEQTIKHSNLIVGQTKTSLSDQSEIFIGKIQALQAQDLEADELEPKINNLLQSGIASLKAIARVATFSIQAIVEAALAELKGLSFGKSQLTNNLSTQQSVDIAEINQALMSVTNQLTAVALQILQGAHQSESGSEPEVEPSHAHVHPEEKSGTNPTDQDSNNDFAMLNQQVQQADLAQYHDLNLTSSQWAAALKSLNTDINQQLQALSQGQVTAKSSLAADLDQQQALENDSPVDTPIDLL